MELQTSSTKQAKQLIGMFSHPRPPNLGLRVLNLLLSNALSAHAPRGDQGKGALLLTWLCSLAR